MVAAESPTITVSKRGEAGQHEDEKRLHAVAIPFNSIRKDIQTNCIKGQPLYNNRYQV